LARREPNEKREGEKEGERRAASIFGALVPTSCMYEREVYVFARAVVHSLPPHRGIGNLWRRAGLFIPATLARRLVSSAARDSIIIDYAQLAGGSWKAEESVGLDSTWLSSVASVSIGTRCYLDRIIAVSR